MKFSQFGTCNVQNVEEKQKENTPGLSGFWDQSQANSALYSTFRSVEQTDFKNVIVENIHWALFEDAEVAESNNLETQNDKNSIMKSDKN